MYEKPFCSMLVLKKVTFGKAKFLITWFDSALDGTETFHFVNGNRMQMESYCDDFTMFKELIRSIIYVLGRLVKVLNLPSS